MLKTINAITGNEYTGGNEIILLSSGFIDQKWATYKQWKNAGFQVQKNECGTKLSRIVTVKDKKTGEDKRVPRFFTVFNIEQVKEIAVKAA